jgi:hypothetical protein
LVNKLLRRGSIYLVWDCRFSRGCAVNAIEVASEGASPRQNVQWALSLHIYRIPKLLFNSSECFCIFLYTL